MADDELVVTAAFDGTQLAEGIKRAAEAIFEGTEQMQLAFDQVATGEERLEASSLGLTPPLTDLYGRLEAVMEAALGAGAPLEGVLAPSMKTLAEAASSVSAPIQDVYGRLQSLIEAGSGGAPLELIAASIASSGQAAATSVTGLNALEQAYQQLTVATKEAVLANDAVLESAKNGSFFDTYAAAVDRLTIADENLEAAQQRLAALITAPSSEQNAQALDDEAQASARTTTQFDLQAQAAVRLAEAELEAARAEQLLAEQGLRSATTVVAQSDTGTGPDPAALEAATEAQQRLNVAIQATADAQTNLIVAKEQLSSSEAEASSQISETTAKLLQEAQAQREVAVAARDAAAANLTALEVLQQAQGASSSSGFTAGESSATQEFQRASVAVEEYDRTIQQLSSAESSASVVTAQTTQQLDAQAQSAINDAQAQRDLASAARDAAQELLAVQSAESFQKTAEGPLAINDTDITRASAATKELESSIDVLQQAEDGLSLKAQIVAQFLELQAQASKLAADAMRELASVPEQQVNQTAQQTVQADPSVLQNYQAAVEALNLAEARLAEVTGAANAAMEGQAAVASTAAEGQLTLASAFSTSDAEAAKLALEAENLNSFLDAFGGVSAQASTGIGELGARSAEASSNFAAMDDSLRTMAEAQTTTVSSTDELLSELANIQVATNEAAAGAAQYAVTMDDSVVPTEKMAKALEVLNNAEAVANATGDQLKQKLAIVGAEADKMGLTLVRTANGWKLVQQAEEEAETQMSSLNNALAQGLVRTAFLEAGSGQLGFAMARLVQLSPQLAAALASIFAVVGPIILLQVIDDLIDKFDEMNNTLLKSRADFDDMAGSMLQMSSNIELTNLKLDDQIRKMQGVPEENELHEALVQNTIAAENFAKALEDDTVKVLQLLKTGEIGIWRSLLTGADTTTDLQDKFQQTIGAYTTATSQLRLALAEQHLNATDANRQAVVDAQASVVIARKRALDVAEATRDATLKARQEASVTHEEIRYPEAGVYNAIPQKLQVPALPPEQLEQRFGQRLTYETDYVTLLKTESAVTGQISEAEEKRLKEAAERVAEKARTRQRTEDQPDIKNQQANAEQQASIAREGAQQQYEIAVASSRAIVEQDVLTGVDRAQAAELGDRRIITAQTNLTNQLLAIQTEENRKRIESIEAQGQLDQETLRGDKLVAARKNTEEALLRETQAGEARIQQIINQGNLEVLRDQNDIDKQRIQQRINAENNLANATRSTARQMESQTTAEYQRSVSDIRENATEKLAAVSNAENQHTLSLEAARNQRHAIYEEESQDQFEATQKVIATLQSEQLTIESLMANTKSEQALRTLQNSYDKLTEAITKAITAQNTFNNTIGKAEIKNQEKYIDDLNRKYLGFFSNITLGMGNAFQQMITGQKTWGQAWASLLVDLEQKALMMIMKVVARHLAAEAVKLTATQASNQMQALSEEEKTAKQLISLVVSLFRHIFGAQTKTAATAASETAQTAATASGAATRAATTSAANISVATSDAAVAGAGTLALLSAMLPPPFPETAALAVYAIGMGFAGAAAFEGGGLIPGHGPVPIIGHGQEMVLPENISTGLQNVIATGGIQPTPGKLNVDTGSGQAAGENITSNIHIHQGAAYALDGHGVNEAFSKNRKQIYKLVHQGLRRGPLRRKLT